MESALDCVSGEIIDAEQLWMLPAADRGNFACQGCGAKVWPASYRATNLVRPYFTLGRAGNHHAGCGVAGERRIIERGRHERVGVPGEGFPASYPARLQLQPGGDRMAAPAETQAAAMPRVSPWGGAIPPAARMRAVGTIRQICRTFINFPYDRDLKLSIPGIDAGQYYSVFKKLKWDALARYPARRIFYAALRWSRPLDTGASLEIPLDAGARDGGRLLRGHRVRVDWAGWSQASKTCLRKELDVAREEGKQAFERHETRKKAYLFFIGDQDAGAPSLFQVTDHRLICCLVDEITYPRR